jgi:hypothetical protein
MLVLSVEGKLLRVIELGEFANSTPLAIEMHSFRVFDACVAPPRSSHFIAMLRTAGDIAIIEVTRGTVTNCAR